MMALDSYLTLEELKVKSFGEWDDCWTSFAEDKLEVASAVVDQLFYSYGLTVEDRLASGKLNEKLLKDVVASMVLRVIKYAVSVGELEASSITERAGDYSVQFDIASNTINKDLLILSKEKAKLGLPSLIATNVSMIPGCDDDD